MDYSAVHGFSRRPYKVEYYKDGKKHVINRRPPPKIHDMLPEDIVTITKKRNQDWDEGKEVEIERISERQPNTLLVKDYDNKHTFLSYSDVFFEGREDNSEDILASDNKVKRRDPIGSDYLLWP